MPKFGLSGEPEHELSEQVKGDDLLMSEHFFVWFLSWVLGIVFFHLLHTFFGHREIYVNFPTMFWTSLKIFEVNTWEYFKVF